MMTPKNKAEALVNSYRFILMNEDTECGNEILCTSIAKQCALISVDEISKHCYEVMKSFWEEVKQEIEKI
jgi:hypothetical protein